MFLCLLAIYLVWGSTYLAQRFALATFPPFMLGALRCGLAGTLLLSFLKLRGEAWPTRRELLATAPLGALFFVGGTGFVSVAQQYVSSSVAAIVVATMPLWAALFAGFFGVRPSRLEIVGLVLGISGVALLQRGGAFSGSTFGFVMLVIAPMLWALGTVLAPRLGLKRPAMSSALQMGWGGLILALLSVVCGEELRPMTGFSAAAALYLLLFGSLLGFGAFSYLLSHARPAVATSYAFVNPVVALLLGSALAAEALDAASLGACALTISGVVAVLFGKNRGPVPERGASDLGDAQGADHQAAARQIGQGDGMQLERADFPHAEG